MNESKSSDSEMSLESTQPALTTLELPKSEASRKNLFWIKLVVALAVAVITCVIGSCIGFFALRLPSSQLTVRQQSTQNKMFFLESEINQYKEEKKTYPLTLEELFKQQKSPKSDETFDNWIQYNASDAWKNHIIYISDGQHWKLMSLGADGQSGGVGLDADIWRLDTDGANLNCRPSSPPTFYQVVTSREFHNLVSLSTMFGIIFFFITISQLLSFKISRVGEIIVATVGLILVSCIFVGIHVFVQSIASGH
jgi:general secretion pathway protein G